MIRRDNAHDARNKSRKFKLKKMMQMTALMIIALLLFRSLFDTSHYIEPDHTAWTNTQGFVALSYFGVNRTGGAARIAKKQLDRHLKALYDNGYITISQQDIIDFYLEGKPVPDKALFLIFEDGRSDTGLFGQVLLAKYNFKATILPNESKRDSYDYNFLQSKDLQRMVDSSYWEAGVDNHFINGKEITAEKREEIEARIRAASIQAAPGWNAKQLLMEVRKASGQKLMKQE